MARTTEILLREALVYAEEVISNTAEDDPELPVFKLRREKIKSKLNLPQTPSRFISGFKPIVWGDPQCPHCWVLRDVHTALTYTSTSRQQDRYRCKICNYEVGTPAI